MPIKKHFINKGIQYMMIDEYLRKKFIDAGYEKVKIESGLHSTKVTIHAARPGLIIGSHGKSINELTNYLSEEFKLEAPQIKIAQVKVPEMNAQIMANRLSFNISSGENFRRATYSILRRIMKEDVRGAEVIISGQMTSQRARRQAFRVGVIPKTGEPAMHGVMKGVAHCLLKQGMLGIIVKIFPASYKMPDTIILKQEESIKKSVQKDKVLEILEKQAGEDIAEVEDLFEETGNATEEEIQQEFEEYSEILDSGKQSTEADGSNGKVESEQSQDAEIDNLLDEAASISKEIAEKVDDANKEIKNEIEQTEQPKKTRGRKKKE